MLVLAHRFRYFAISMLTVVGCLAINPAAQAMPAFARQYDMSCAACHDAFPRLNAFGEHFRDNNYRMPNWREQTTVNTQDDMLALPKFPPLAIRAQAYVQGRQGENIDPNTGSSDADAEADFQAPYLIKLLSSAPLSDHITYYFYGIFAEKGANGETIIEDAWFRHDDAFGSGIGTMLGQFQVSDLMFPREIRLTFQDFMAYRMAGITYDRGVIFDRGLGPVSLAVGAVNGNGISENFNINSPGYRRADHMFDRDTRKNVFGRVGVDLGSVMNLGVFALSGEQRSVTGAAAGTVAGIRDTGKRIYGLDLSGSIGAKTHWFAQGLWNEWDGFIDTNPSVNYKWFGGFAGVDYVHSPRWAYSLLINYADPRDLDGSGTIFEGIHMRTVTLAAAYYFMRNVKGVIELNGDFLAADSDADFVGHESKEGYLLVGLDAAF